MAYRQNCMIISRFPVYFGRKPCVRYQHNGRIFVEPLSSLVTESVSIHGNGFRGGAPITIKACVECPIEKISFKSFGHYITSKDGKFNLSSSESVGGSYEGTDCMGLFWSMVATGSSQSRVLVTNASLAKTYTFSVFDEHIDTNDKGLIPICSTSIERHFIVKDTERQSVKIDKLRGTLFTPKGEGCFPAIITLYGTNKGGQVIEDVAAALSNFGFITLALQYYGSEGLPSVYTEEPIRIERFEAAVDYLLSLENCHSVGVYGLSKGAEIATAMMSFLPKIKAVAWINGHISSVGTSTTYYEKVMPQLGMDYGRHSVLPDGTTISFIDVLNDPDLEPSTIHPLEFSSADLLLVCGLDDRCMKVEHIVEVAKKKMDAVGKTNYEVFKCPGLGHLVDPPFMPICVSASHPSVPRNMRVYYGGDNKKMHAQQQQLVWSKVVSFFHNSLKH